MFVYLLPVENFHGGDGWKMPVIFSIATDLEQLRKNDFVRYIKIMLLAFQKAHEEKSFNDGFSSIFVEGEISRMRLEPNFWDEQYITVEHIRHDEDIKLVLVDHQDITFDVNEPERIKDAINPLFLEYVHHITLNDADLEIIKDE